MTSSASEPPSHVYYFQVGLGDWTGHFRFQVTRWRDFWADPIGFKNRFLSIGMWLLVRLLGAGKITSRLEPGAHQGDARVAKNDVRITKFGVTLYLLREEYILDPNGRDVHVRSNERFGPLPFLFNVAKEHPAEILDGGLRSIYYIPLLGTEWIARYTVREDRQHIDSLLTCKWGEAHEVIDRVR